MKQTLYEILGVSEAATAEVIEQAYSRLAARLDAAGSGPPGEDAVNRLNLAKDAYQTLRDPKRRAAYDARLAPIREEHSAASPEATGHAYRSEPTGEEGVRIRPLHAALLGAILLAGGALAYQWYSDRTEVERARAAAEAERQQVAERERSQELRARREAHEAEARMHRETANQFQAQGELIATQRRMMMDAEMAQKQAEAQRRRDFHAMDTAQRDAIAERRRQEFQEKIEQSRRDR